MIRYTNTNTEDRWVLRLTITIFVILLLVMSTPLRVTATRTVQIEKDIDIEADPRYDWDVRTNYADENATTSWDEWQNFTNLSGAKGSFVGSLVRDTQIDLHQELIFGTNLTDDWTEYTDDVGDNFDWDINEAVIRGYTEGSTFPGNRYAMQVPDDYNMSILKTLSTEIMFDTIATSYSTAGMFFNLDVATGAGYGYLLIYDNDVPTTLGCYRYDGWESVAAIVFSVGISVNPGTWYTLRVDFNGDYDHAWFYFDGVFQGESDLSMGSTETVGLYVESTGTGIKAWSDISFKWFGGCYNPIFIASVVQFSPNDIMSGGSKWWLRTPVIVKDEDLLNTTRLNITLKVYHVQNARILNFTVDNTTKDFIPRQFSHSTLIVNETYDYMRPDTNTTLTENGHYIVDNRTYMEVKAPIFPLTDEAYAFCFMINGSIPINISLNEADMGQDDIFLTFIDDGIDEEIDYIIAADLGMSFLFTEGMRDGVTGENFNFTRDYDKVIGITDGYYANFQYDEQHTNNVSDTYLTTIDRKIWENIETDRTRTDTVIYNGFAYYTQLTGTNGQIVRYNITTGVKVSTVLIDTAMGSTILSPVIDYTNEYVIVPFKNKTRGYDLDLNTQ